MPIEFEVLTYLGLFAAGFSCVVVGLAHLAVRPSSRKAAWGCAAFTCLGFNAVFQSIVWLDLESLLPFVLYLNPYLLYFAAPCFYYYLIYLADPDGSPGKAAPLLFLPPLAATLSTLPYFLARPDLLSLMLELSDSRVYDHLPASFSFVHASWADWFVVCFAFFVFRIIRLKRGSSESWTRRSLLFAGFGISVLAWYLSYQALLLFSLGSYAILIGILIFFIPPFVVLRYPRILGIGHALKTSGRYASPKTGTLDVAAAGKQLDSLMTEKKLFLDEHLTLQSVADAAYLSAHQLSEILNGSMGKNFRDWLNEYRVREIQRLIVEHPEKTILELALDSGFGSKSSFNQVFLRVTGKTPRAWKQESVCRPDKD
ncbi:MAG: AraC family transcriptional regulator [Spirochaetales bacterium]|nr:AraC family transcriptional regulator [Spirochaetales bacterium]